MIIFMDGPQSVGKSTLINYLINHSNFKNYKFDFSKYSKIFNIDKKNKLKYYQIGKDFSTLYWLDKLSKKEDNIIIDRGIISSIYYSINQKRMSEKEILNYLECLKEFDNFKFLFILPKKRKEKIIRNKNDGFDNLDNNEYDYEAVEYINNYCKANNIDFEIFYNNFSKSIEENGEKLINYLRNEE